MALGTGHAEVDSSGHRNTMVFLCSLIGGWDGEGQAVSVVDAGESAVG
jgi:hypothetical protein